MIERVFYVMCAIGFGIMAFDVATDQLTTWNRWFVVIILVIEAVRNLIVAKQDPKVRARCRTR